MILRIRVKPHAPVDALAMSADGTWVARVKAVPVDGKANEALLALVARHFGCRRTAVTLRSGAGARQKLVEIDDRALPPRA
ncbi:MAG: DUF167 domain-containing protein [Proteobacteria bacterium]|nr:DUF167 domain-containing protein [Pseudomonadota bacterium]